MRVNGFTGFAQPAPPALILPCYYVKIDNMAARPDNKPVNPFITFVNYSPHSKIRWYKSCNISKSLSNITTKTL